MATEATTATKARLRRNVLTLPQVSFQGIAHIAPSINVVFTFPVIALKAGPTMPISFLLTTIVCIFIANTVSQFSRYMPSSGGFGAIEILIMLALAFTFLVHPGPGSHYAAPLQPKNAPNHFEGILAAGPAAPGAAGAGS